MFHFHWIQMVVLWSVIITTLGPRGEGLKYVTAHFMEIKMRGNHRGSFRRIPDVSFIGKYNFGQGAILILLLSYCNPPYSGECVHSPPFPKTKSFVIPSEIKRYCLLCTWGHFLFGNFGQGDITTSVFLSLIHNKIVKCWWGCIHLH